MPVTRSFASPGARGTEGCSTLKVKRGAETCLPVVRALWVQSFIRLLAALEALEIGASWLIAELFKNHNSRFGRDGSVKSTWQGNLGMAAQRISAVAVQTRRVAALASPASRLVLTCCAATPRTSAGKEGHLGPACALLPT